MCDSMQGRTLALMLLVAAVATAGCTSLFGGDGEDGPDVRITEDDGLSTTLTSLSSTYREGEDIGLRLAVANTGEAPARDITARLFGPLFLNVDTCGDMYRDVASRLTGVDRAAAQDGQETAVEWTCTNPVDLPAGETQDVRAGAVVAYRYNTTASASFRVVPRETFTGTSSPVSTDSSAAPVSAEIDLSSPVTLTPPDDDDEPVETFNVTQVTVDPGAETIAFTFNHPVDEDDFNLGDDLSTFGAYSPDWLTFDAENADIDGNTVTFPVDTGGNSLANTDVRIGTVRATTSLENTENDQALRQVICDFRVGDDVTEHTDCGQQSWRPHAFYWHSFRIYEEDGEPVARLRFSEDIGDFEIESMDGLVILNASSNDPSEAVSFGGSLSGVSGEGNVIEMSLDLNESYTLDDLAGEEFEVEFGETLTDTPFAFVSRESDRRIVLGSCAAVFGEDWKTDEGVRTRHCASRTEDIERFEGGFAVPLTVRNVGDGMVGGIDQEAGPVELSAAIPNAPDGVEIQGCLGQQGFPVSVDLFGDRRDITCTMTLPEEAYDTQMTIEISMSYPYVETVETGFTLEGVP